MSKLDELIKELCPDGVVYKPLWELTAWDKRFNAVDKSMQKKIIKYHYFLASDLKPLVSDDGDIKILTTNTSDLYTKEELVHDYVSEGEIVAIPWGGNPNVQYYKGKFITADNRIMTSLDTSVLDNKFLYYYLQSKIDLIASFYRGSGIKHPSMLKMLTLQIPLPALLIQREIVHILDSFTLLTAELTAELTARRQQYEYYRDYLLNFEANSDSVADDCEKLNFKEVKWCKLQEIAEIGTGSSNTNEGLEEGLYPFYVRSQEPLRKNEYEYDETAIITAGDGVGVGKVYHFVKGKYALHQRAYRIHIISDDVLPKFYFYYMSTKFMSYIEKTMYHGSVPSIRRPMLNAFPVPVPPIETQKKIVAILDRFDKLANDMSEGLPAEIEARKQQYEYYRDVLLSFDEERRSQFVKVERERERERERELTRSKALKWFKLGEIATITRGTRVVRKQLQESGNYPVYQNSLTPLGYYDNNNRHANTAYVIAAGAAGEIGYSYIDFWAADDCYTFDCPETLNSRYLYYVLMSKQSKILSQVRKSSIPRLPRAVLDNLIIPVPSLDEQERIVSILDRFDKLCNDISEGIPAEIEARQKQYEYYRDKLLSFKAKE